MTNVRSAKFFAVVAAVLALAFSQAPAQTAPVPPPTAHATGQIAAGTTGTISPAQGVTPATAGKAAGILKGALTPKTRQTLQDAMNAAAPPP